MISDSDLEIPYAGGKVVAAGRTVWIVKPQCLPKVSQAVTCYCPVGDVIMNLLRIHVVHVLQVLLTTKDGKVVHAGALAAMGG